MAKFYATIGYSAMTEVRPGVWSPENIERTYYGESTRNISKFQTSGEVNDNVNVTNEVSIVADPYAFANFYTMRYIIFSEIPGVKWSINDVEVKRPRLLLSIGGVYHDEQSTGTSGEV